MTNKTDTPAPGDRVTLTCEVVHTHATENGKYYGDMTRLVVRLLDGPAGFELGDLRLVADDRGEWINNKLRAALDGEPKADKEATGAEATPDMTVKQLRHLADARGVEVPAKATKKELLALLAA